MRGGGILGLVTTTTADSGELAPDDADALRAQVDGCGLLQLAGRAGATSSPDAFAYEIIVDDGERSQKVALAENDLPDDVRSLISWLDAVPGRQQRVGPPGGS